jgi:hypothetical protein
VQIGKRREGFHLLAEYASDEADGKPFVALNPRITEAILGQRSYTRIEMDEVRGLKSDPARLIHQRLCGWLDPGSRHSVGLDTLMGYVSPDNVDPASRTFRKRRAAVNKALDELKTISWKVHEYAIAKYHIARPALLETTPGLTVPDPRINGSGPRRICCCFKSISDHFPFFI